METDNKWLYRYNSNKIKEVDIDLWERINNIPFDISFKEKFYFLENSLTDLPKCECGNYVKFIDMINGYRSFCSKRCVWDSKLLKDNKKITCIKKWGVDNPSKAKEIRDKVKRTNIEKFGHEWATKSDNIKEKIKEKFIENWGVDNPSKIKEVREKAKSTMVEKFGVEHAMWSPDIKEKVKNKFIEKWGVDNPSKLEEVKRKKRETTQKNWGVDVPLKSDEIKNKIKETNLEKWGVEWTLQNNDIRDKIKETNLKKWGVDNPSKSEMVKDKIKNSILDKWGTLNLYEVKEIRDKINESNFNRFGDHISKNSKYREKYKISNDQNYIKYLENGISLFNCDKGFDHTFEIYIDNYLKRYDSKIPLCTICNPIGDSKSIKEKEVYLYIKEVYSGEIIQSYRDGLEIDIYLPDLKLGFEFNGLYWHSESKKEKNYHIDKTNYFKDRGIRIIHIWEDDWTFNREIMKSQINNWLKLTSSKIWARKCVVKIINDIKETRSFLNKNHIQGYVNNSLSIGLYYNNKLISLMTFDHNEGRKKMDINEWNLSRFCNELNTIVIGGASKLLKFFIENYNPIKIISYADKDWSTGDLYRKIGFVEIGNSKPDYKYVVNERRVHKSRYRNSNLLNIKENEYAKINNMLKIWDCGKLKFQLILLK